jgi:hypothetical protein
VSLLVFLLWWLVFALDGPRIEWTEKILEKAARPRLCPPVLVLLITEKLGLGGRGEGDFDRNHNGAFGYCENGRCDKTTQEPDFTKHGDRLTPAKVTRKRPPTSNLG